MKRQLWNLSLSIALCTTLTGCGNSQFDDFVIVGPGPVAVDDNFQVNPNTTLTINAPGVLTNDSLNGAGLSPLSAFATAQGGTVDLLADGSFTYNPALGFVGTDSFVYQLAGGSANAQAAVSILVERALAAFELASRTPAGGFANDNSDRASISADGRFVVFQSDATDILTDTNGQEDSYLLDRQLQAFSRVNVNSNGDLSDMSSSTPFVSGMGRFITFNSAATNLVTGDSNGESDVFLHDRETGQTQRVSVDLNGGDSNGTSVGSTVSEDGRWVAFQSSASDLVAGDGEGQTDIFLRDTVNNTTSRLSEAPGGQGGTDISNGPRVSNDGGFVVFTSRADNLVPNDTGNRADVFVYNRQADALTRVSVNSQNQGADRDCLNAKISGDGRFVVFASDASNLVANDTNGSGDVFLVDRLNNTIERVSLTSAGGEVDHGNTGLRPDVSDDGRFVVFLSRATDLVSGDTNGQTDLFLRDLQSGTTVRLSLDSNGQELTRSSARPVISRNGRYIAFDSRQEVGSSTDHVVVVANPFLP